MHQLNVKYPILLALFISTVFPFEITKDSLTIAEPRGWSISSGENNILVIARSPSPKATGNDRIPTFVDNFVITKERMNPNKENLFQKDPIFYLKVILYQSTESLDIINEQKHVFGGIHGIYFKGRVSQFGLEIGNVEFFFLRGSNLYGIIFSCLYQDLEKNMPIFMHSMGSLKEKK